MCLVYYVFATQCITERVISGRSLHVGAADTDTVSMCVCNVELINPVTYLY